MDASFRTESRLVMVKWQGPWRREGLRPVQSHLAWLRSAANRTCAASNHATKHIAAKKCVCAHYFHKTATSVGRRHAAQSRNAYHVISYHIKRSNFQGISVNQITAGAQAGRNVAKPL